MSSIAQVKNGTLGVSGLAVFGNTLLQGGSYLNFGSTAGANGYGIWDNSGVLEFKPIGGSWQTIQAMVATLVGTAGAWALNGTSLYYNGGNVGIGISTPAYPLETEGTGTGNFGGTPEIFANGDNHTVGGLAISDDGGFYDYNDYWVTFNGSTGLKIAGNNGAASTGGNLLVTGTVSVDQGWSPDQGLSINSNQVWNGTNGNTLYLQWSNSGGGVVIGGQSGYTNNLDVEGQIRARDGIKFSDGSVQTTAAAGAPSATTETCTAGWCTTPSCPAGYVRSGCSVGGYGQQSGYTSAGPSSSQPNACECNVYDSGSGTMTCTTYCIN